MRRWGRGENELAPHHVNEDPRGPCPSGQLRRVAGNCSNNMNSNRMLRASRPPYQGRVRDDRYQNALRGSQSRPARMRTRLRA